jgi:hypothetical protein
MRSFRYVVAAATGAHLITTDTDFDPLHPDDIRCTVILGS